MTNIFFESWTKVGHVALLTVISFVTLFLFIRISGKRTLAKFNAFDFVVTITLGSVLAYMMLAQVNLTEGVVVLFLIIALQLLFAKFSQKSEFMEKMLNSSPKLLFYNGTFLKKSMKKELVTKEEILASIRREGIENTDDVLAVVIEANGDLSVIEKSDNGSIKSTLKGIESQGNEKL
ncbi:MULTISPECIES: YetF domain-containing protein [Chryseobacterium]|jgi:uncharacterized membrane protein YcaP (DUF421 family)|uniref:DUF421 domain-containing protein n=1 Tax=Chryseobacterium TaxID=59732 RepID=UPI0028A0C588|nr:MULTISPECIES: YetF domain-containing protein [Chryseobacterium]MEC5174053.1 uncharacterized membrane protein YcaP (DUF421 family) [Chryseobacterium nepalense]